MGPFAILFVVAGLGLIAWLSGRARAMRLSGYGVGARPHSLPDQHGWYVALWTAGPALLFLVAWTALSPSLIEAAVAAQPAATALPEPGFERDAILAEARSLAAGRAYGGFYPLSERLAPAFAAASARFGWIGAGIALLLAFAGGAFAFTRVRADFRARTRVERAVMAALLVASLIAILTTLGIFASLVFESARFFSMVPITDFLFGTRWSPQVISASDPGATLGAVPLFWGTFFIGAVIAMIVAIPFGLMSAILEMLAGVPTVVYGYFAALTVGPAIRDAAVALGMTWASSESALSAGLVMGIMIIPFVSSMADDSIAAVPTAMRDGSLAMGATTSETIRRVMIPAALPGVVAGVLLAVSRAIGETMIVVMAASGAATITLNPLESATTVTKQIVDLLTGEAEFDSPKTLAAFALGLTLFLITLLLNVVALNVVKKYREAYE
jgi:phosphate transport system permease protein